MAHSVILTSTCDMPCSKLTANHASLVSSARHAEFCWRHSLKYKVALVGAKQFFQLSPGVTLVPLATRRGSVRPSQTPPARIKRSAIPACLKTVELSCLNLAANCIDTVDYSTIKNLWGIKSCVAAATCYGVGDLITSVECQTGYSTSNSQESLDYNIYASIVGSCAYATSGCPITQQNYTDFYYRELTAIKTANYPSSNSVVIAFWTAITAWAATGSSIPYKNFDDWLHYSSYPYNTTTPTSTTTPTYTAVNWNPNPYPPPTAVSETFVGSGTTLVIAVPTTSTIVTVANATITLAPGGTPVGGPVPAGIYQPGAVTPIWDNNIIPPVNATAVTFMVPPSYTSIVPVPTASNSPGVNVTGPPGDKNKDGDDWWLLLFGALIGGSLPLDVSIPGGITPTAVPPPAWTGSWSDPAPSPTSSSSSSSSSTSSSYCARPTAAYSLSDDSENADWEDNGTDPDMRRKRSGDVARRTTARWIYYERCDLRSTNDHSVSLGKATWWTLNGKGGTSTTLLQFSSSGNPQPDGANSAAQEHVFELGYMGQFFASALLNAQSCAWFENNIFNYVRTDGTNLGLALVKAIDQVSNMVWVDTAMNQAKSNVVNQNRKTADNPPQLQNMKKIRDFDKSKKQIEDVEYFIRNIAALGQYFSVTSTVFHDTAQRVQNLLAEVTPNTPINPSLPSAFNDWLRNLLSTYPTGCTDRATNTFNYYRTHMSQLSSNTNPLETVPTCYSMYYANNYSPSSFAWQPLAPAAPTLPLCDGPGTTGGISVGTAADSPEYIVSGSNIVTYRVMGSGNTDHFALGSGTSLATSHWSAQTISNYANCNGVYLVVDATPATGLLDLNIALNCGGQTGVGVAAPFNFVLNGQQFGGCTAINFNDGSGRFDIICGPSQTASDDCGRSVISSGSNPTNFPKADTSVISFTFYGT